MLLWMSHADLGKCTKSANPTQPRTTRITIVQIVTPAISRARSERSFTRLSMR